MAPKYLTPTKLIWLAILSAIKNKGSTNESSSSESNDGGDPEGHANWGLLDHENCGISLSNRIIGGTDAALGEFPWIARVGERGKKEVSYWCGGSILNENIVVTAAHCIDRIEPGPKPNTVKAGEYDKSTKTDCVGSVCSKYQDREIEKWIIHEKWDKATMFNDIALIKIKGKFVFNDFIGPVCLMTSAVVKDHLKAKKFEAIGFGLLDEKTRKWATVLQKITLDVVPVKKCTSAFAKYKVGSSSLCMGGTAGHNVCGGDVGGPMMFKSSADGKPKAYIVGIASLRDAKGCQRETPSVFTRVSNYGEWILGGLTS